MKRVEDVARLTCKAVLEEIAPEELRVFNKLWECTVGDMGLSRISELGCDGSVEEYAVSDPGFLAPRVQSISFNVIKVVACVLDATSDQRDVLDVKSLGRILSECMKKAETPGWMREHFMSHVPKLLLEGFQDSGLSVLPQNAAGEFVVYLGHNDPEFCGEERVEYYREKGRLHHFTVFIDDTKKIAKVRQHAAPFRVGDNFPYVILRYLLTRVGQEVSYAEIYRTTEPYQTTWREKGRSKFVHKYVTIIKKGLESVDGVAKGEPEFWFTPYGSATILVWRDLNSCLIMRS